MRRRIATVLFAGAVMVGGIATPALAGHHVGSCPNPSSGWTLLHNQTGSAHDKNGDGHICVKVVNGNGNHGEGVSHKDNNGKL